MTKRIFALLFAVLMTCIATTPAFAAETKEIDYMNYDFPEDAIVLYQGEDGVVYQSKMESAEEEGTRSTQYNYAWLNAGDHSPGSFGITNPHPSLITTTYGTFKIESNYSYAQARMTLMSNSSVLADKTVRVSDGDVHFSFKSLKTNLTVSYSILAYSNTHGMRLMCWLW